MKADNVWPNCEPFCRTPVILFPYCAYRKGSAHAANNFQIVIKQYKLIFINIIYI